MYLKILQEYQKLTCRDSWIFIWEPIYLCKWFMC